MASLKAIEGVAQVIENLKMRGEQIAAGTERGLKAAGLFLQRQSQKKVPVDFGVLKNSAFTRANGKGFSTQVEVGYTASYALFVHEAVGMVLKGQERIGGKGRYWDPQGQAQPKFLEEPARSNAKELRDIIREHAKIK